MLKNKVLKPGPDCMVRLRKPRTVHFCSSFSLKNHSIGKKSRDPCELQLDLMVLRIVNGSCGSLFFSKYRLKLKIWPACTLDFFQILNQKIYERKKENKLRRRRWQSRGCVKLKQQASNLAQLANHGLHLHLLLLFLLLTSFSPSSLSFFRLHCCGFRFSPSLCLCLCWFYWILFYVSKALSHDLH